MLSIANVICANKIRPLIVMTNIAIIYNNMQIFSQNFKQKVTSLFINDDIYSDIINDIQGDAQTGVSYNEVIEFSLAYLCNFCFNNLSDEDFTLNNFKGILDKANIALKLGYKPTIIKGYNGNASFNDCTYFKEAYALVQFDYYFKAINLKETDFFKYTQHYFLTGKKLDINSYIGDKEYLEKEYSKMDKDGMHRANLHISKAFTGALFLLLNELNLPTHNFKNNVKDCREYNAMTKTPREFRKYFPFQFSEYDIKNAFPRFIDEIIGSNVAANVYELVMETYSVNRSEAKILFNKMLNSGKYKTAEQFRTFFRPIYKEHTEALVKLLTNKEKPFWKLMFYWEYIAVETFIKSNNLLNYVRLHDAIFIVNNEFKNIKDIDFSFVTFGAKKFYNIPSIGVGLNKKTANKYVPAIPFELKKNTMFEVNHTAHIQSKVFGKFRIYREPFYYLNANFNIASNGVVSNGSFKEYDSDYFLNKLQNMVNVIAFLNDYDIRQIKFLLKAILFHIQENGVLTFDLNDVLEFLIIGIEEPKYRVKNHLYTSTENIDLFQYQSEYYKAVKMFDLVAISEAIFPIVEKSYKDKEKIYIDVRDLGIQKSKGYDVIFDLIERFNTANGFDNDIRTCEKIRETYKLVHDVCHTIYKNSYRVAKFVHNTSKNKASQHIGVNRRTYDKFLNWFNHKQDLHTISDVYFTLQEIIKKAELDFEIIAENGRNRITKKETQSNNDFKSFAEVWNNLAEVFPSEAEFAEQMKNSVLNKDEVEVITLHKQFYDEWEAYQYKIKNSA